MPSFSILNQFLWRAFAVLIVLAIAGAAVVIGRR